jgi:stress response protein SCP2
MKFLNVFQLCERLIQQLQARLLEEQQKLAVAVQVDRGKDRAILQLQNAWKRVVHHWTELEEQRHNLASRLLKERDAHQRQESEMAQVNLVVLLSFEVTVFVYLMF